MILFNSGIYYITFSFLFLAGHLPLPADGNLIVGKVGKDITPEDAAIAARYVALNILATVKGKNFSSSSKFLKIISNTLLFIMIIILFFIEEIGNLNKIKKIVKITGFVNCVDGFAGQPAVVNGASNLFKEVLGEAGVHSRSAVGTNALPFNVPVEIEAIIEVE